MASKWLVAAVAVAIGSTGHAEVTGPKAKAEAEAALPAARKALDDALLDYPSARFRDVRAIVAPKGGLTLFCGQVNAKTRAGGYGGWQPMLIWLGENPKVYLGEGDKIVLEAACSNPTGTLEGDYAARLAYSPAGDRQ